MTQAVWPVRSAAADAPGPGAGPGAGPVDRATTAGRASPGSASPSASTGATMASRAPALSAPAVTGTVAAPCSAAPVGDTARTAAVISAGPAVVARTVPLMRRCAPARRSRRPTVRAVGPYGVAGPAPAARIPSGTAAQAKLAGRSTSTAAPPRSTGESTSTVNVTAAPTTGAADSATATVKQSA
ncbi:hypothetical protein [Dactylosporangium sp. NPDC051541]|uniref:hypothetical protein n=1 Tax=Dactylosporangium sp. NPDC051541 TaxID=3363977 RepID=UPI0037B7555E